MHCGEAAIKVWDLPLRLFHWLLLVLVVFSWWSGKRGGAMLPLHAYSGYSILALIFFRLAWGVFGSDTARFASFVRGPRHALAYLRSIATRHPQTYLGHNPLGGWMVVALLASLLAQALSGLCASDDIAFSGPLAHLVGESASELLTTLHKFNAYVLLCLVALHVTAVLTHVALRRDALIAAMLHGRKPAPAGTPPLRFASSVLAALLLAVAALLVYTLTRLG